MNEEKPKKKRAWKSKNRPHHIMVRAKQKEHRELKKLCKKSGLSMSAHLLSSTLNNGVISREETEYRDRLLDELLYKLSKAGDNVNQIAHVSNLFKNGHGPKPSEKAIESVLSQLDIVLQKLNEAI